jgi:hypothetical protein
MEMAMEVEKAIEDLAYSSLLAGAGGVVQGVCNIFWPWHCTARHWIGREPASPCNTP